MRKRNVLSSIDRLDPSVRELISRLRNEKGCTLDQIRAKLVELDVEVSRSALGRHVRSIAYVGERMRRSTDITNAVVRLGDRAQNKMLRGTIELLQSVLLEVSLAEEESEEGVFRPVQFTPLQVKALAQTAEALARAEKIDADREIKLKQEFDKETARKLDAGAKAGDIDVEAVERAKRILGYS